MTASGTGPDTAPGFGTPGGLPEEVRHYLTDLVRRVQDVGGEYLVSVGAVGSLALGDYRATPGRHRHRPRRGAEFWFVIDRAIARQSGLTLAGRSIRTVFAVPARRTLLTAVAESVREHATGANHLGDNRVLNGCRSVHYCRTGRWVAKREAARAVAAADERFRPLVQRSVRSFERPRAHASAVPGDEVDRFLAWVRGEVDRALDSAVRAGESASDHRGSSADQ